MGLPKAIIVRHDGRLDAGAALVRRLMSDGLEVRARLDAEGEVRPCWARTPRAARLAFALAAGSAMVVLDKLLDGLAFWLASAATSAILGGLALRLLTPRCGGGVEGFLAAVVSEAVDAARRAYASRKAVSEAIVAGARYRVVVVRLRLFGVIVNLVRVDGAARLPQARPGK